MVYIRVLSLIFFVLCMSPLASQVTMPDSTVQSQMRPDTSRIPALLQQKSKKISGLAKQGLNEITPAIPRAKAVLGEVASPGKELIRDLGSRVDLFKGKPGIRINDIHANLGYTRLGDTSGVSTGILQDIRWIYQYDLGLTLSLSSLPFEFRISGNESVFDFYNTPLNKFTQFNFDHKKYLDQVQKLVTDKVDPSKVLNSILSRIDKVRKQYEESLRNEVLGIQAEFRDAFSQPLDLPASLTDLSVTDMTSLRTSLIPADLQARYEQHRQLLANLAADPGSNASGLIRDSIRNRALSEMGKMEALEKVLGRITEWKSKFDANPVVKELRSHLPFTPASFSSYLKKPSSLVDVVKKQANLNTLQRLFLHITQLDIGTNPLNGGEFNFRDMMNNGVNTTFTNNRSSVGMVRGNGNANVNGWLQSGLTSFITNEYSRMSGIRLGSGWNSSFKRSLSINFFDFRPSPDISQYDPSMLRAGYAAAPARRDAVITWQSAVSLPRGQQLNLGVSKTFGAYRYSASADSNAVKQNAFENVFGGQGMANFAASLEYKGNILKTDIQAFVKKAGLGYNNPGDLFVRRGEDRAGLGISKKLLKQKLTLRYKTDIRYQRFDPARYYTYSAFSNNLQLGYRINRYNRFGLSYRQNSYRFSRGGIKEKGGSYNLQADAVYLFKLGGKKVNNFFSLARQKFDIPVLAGDKYISRTWLISQHSSLQLKKDILSLDVIVNQSDNRSYYFNTSQASGELSYSYALGEKLRLTSGTGYYANTGWNTQVGFRQQVSGTLMKKMDIDLDLSYKKGLKVIRTELANQLFITASLNYRF